MFSIHSTSSDRQLCFLRRSGDDFVVELLSDSLKARLSVSAYTDRFGLLELFEKLGAATLPWPDEQRWASLESEFELSASCSVSGHVLFRVSLRDLFGSPEEWQVVVGITSELGQLPAIAAQARIFFAGEHA